MATKLWIKYQVEWKNDDRYDYGTVQFPEKAQFTTNWRIG